MARVELSEDARGPYLLLAHVDLGEVAAWLAARGVPFEEDPDASVTCAGPVVGVLRFATDIDRAAVDRLLRSYPDPR